MSLAAAATPRKKLPPPTTSPICTPVLATSAISAANSWTRCGSMPKDAPPARASPLSLSRTRLNLGMWAGRGDRLSLGWLRLRRTGFRGLFDHYRVTDLEAHEPRYRDVFAEFCDSGFNQVP